MIKNTKDNIPPSGNRTELYGPGVPPTTVRAMTLNSYVLNGFTVRSMKTFADIVALTLPTKMGCC